MTIDWNAFTPWSSLAGGALIGIARSDIGRRVAFAAGLLSAPFCTCWAAWRGARKLTPVTRLSS